MNGRFSAQELFTLRNHIPIDVLIEKVLLVPSKFSEGFFRFLCPLCSGFNTATNPDTNLARCFRCRKNFNTIDMVMIVRKSNFVESVRFLRKCLPKKQGNRPIQAAVHFDADGFLSQDTKPNTQANYRKNVGEDRAISSPNTLNSQPKGSKDPVSIGSVVHKSLSHLNQQYRINETRLSTPPVFKTDLLKSRPKSPVIQCIESLEQKIENLSEQLDRIEAAILSILP